MRMYLMLGLSPMSSLIFHTDRSQAFVATDTLATSNDGEPFMFTTKAFVIPHLRLIICGTGAGGFLGKWFIQVNDRMILRGIDNLDYHAPKSLSALWRGYKEESSPPDSLTATVYHFGFSEEDSLIHSYVYRSTNDFKSETLPDGIAVKPKCTIPDSDQRPIGIKKIMEEQRTTEASKPKDARVYIGGKIQIHHLTEFGFNIYTLDQFDDYESTEQAIFEKYHSR